MCRRNILRGKRISLVAKEGVPMLLEPTPPDWSEADLQVFECLVLPEHYLRRALTRVLQISVMYKRTDFHYWALSGKAVHSGKLS